MVEIAGVQNEGVLRPLPPRWPAVLRDCDLLELAKSAASCMSARYCRMYEGTYYDDRRYNWDGDIEETNFSAGDEVELVDTWSNHVMVKDDDDHYYNVPKNMIEE